jgi:hypothetical protein
MPKLNWFNVAKEDRKRDAEQKTPLIEFYISGSLEGYIYI